MSKHEGILAIQKYSHRKLPVIYIYNHHKKTKERANPTFLERLNDLVDTVAGKYIRCPINNHIPYALLAINFEIMYISNNHQYHLRRLCFQKNANDYLKIRIIGVLVPMQILIESLM